MLVRDHKKQDGVTKERVLALHAQYPHWNASKLARELKCVSAYVRATLKRAGKKNPGTRPAPKKPTRIRVIAIEGTGTRAIAAAAQLMSRVSQPDEKPSRREKRPYWID